MTSDADTDWRQKDDIIECNRQMLQRQVACDVHFLVGETNARQGAHKYMLMSRSHVFAAMLSGPLKESCDKDIAIPDVEAGAFTELLRYTYTGTADLDANNVLPVLYAAKKYDISGLARLCVDFVENQLDVDNACALLEQAHLFDEQDFRSRVLELVLRRGEEVLECEDLGELCHQCLVDVVSADNLFCREEQVVGALDRWAGRECERRGLETTDTNKRIMLGPALYLARLPLLPPQVFVDRVVSRSLLSEEEKVDVMRHFLVPAMRSEHFNCQPRKKEKHLRVHRFDSRNALAWNNKSGENAISFMTNQDICVEGFTVYGTCRGGSHVLQVQGRLLDSSDNVLTSVSCDVTTDSNVDIYDVLFDEARRLARNTWYTLTADIKGSHTYAGTDGRLSAFEGSVVFTFSSTEKSQTGTGVELGQLPGVLFTL
ncbi:BTB/POZ domain-containing protein 6-B-like isoform X2 [Littorina saxatilis]|uniref:BTB domain-containing protein n=2 Tax=Littorina saxatilis TaxID=31220 RepID=A0AAN9GQ60_9CAEN